MTVPSNKYSVHHKKCPKNLAWDISYEEGCRCECPEGWPKTEEEFEDWWQEPPQGWDSWWEEQCQEENNAHD